MAVPYLYDIDVQGILKVLNGTGYLDLDKNEIRNAIIQVVSVEPSTNLAVGWMIYNSAIGHFGYYNGSIWIYPGYDNDKLDGQHGSWYLNRANHTGTQLSTTISDFAEASQDAIGSSLITTNSITLTYDDANNQIKADVKVVGSGGIEIVASGIQLTNTGVGAGIYTKVTVDAKGRVTSATNLSAGDLPAHNHVAANITDFNNAVRTNQLDQMAAPTSTVNFGTQRIINLADPISGKDAANKDYVDSTVAGLAWKNSVKAASTATLTLSGTPTVDGIALSVGDRVLVKDQAGPAQNGIYVVAASAWSRATDTDTWAELVSAAVFISQGSTQADTSWTCIADAGGTLGTSPVLWSQFNGAAQTIGGNGLTKTGNTLDVNVDNQSIEIVSDTVQAKLDSAGALSKSASGMKVNVDNVTIQINATNQIEIKSAYKNKKVTATLTGNGSLTAWNITHNLANKDVIVQIYDGSNGITAFPQVDRPDINSVNVTFKVAPVNAKVYYAVIIG